MERWNHYQGQSDSFYPHEESVAGIPKEALDEYIGETREMCERVSLGLSLVEKQQHDDETLNSIYRDMHSIKGSSHLFGFKMIGQVAHAMETALDPVRHKSIALSSSLVDALYSGLDLVSRILEQVAESGEEDHSCLSQINAVIPRIASLTLDALTSAKQGVDDVNALDSASSSPASSAFEDQQILKMDVENTLKTIQSSFVAQTNEQSRDPKDSGSSKEDHSVDTSTVRIAVGLLDNLMNLVGELVLVRNQMLQFGGRNIGVEFQKLSQRLNVVTSELQNDVMRTRMQPIGPFLGKFHRVVRDMARELNKKIDLKIEGAETELDKTLIEAVKDPLTHLIRNSVDHGIETPLERQKTGKHPVGTVLIRSYHEGGQVVIEVTDDGAGLSPVKIARRAVEKGIISNDDLTGMSAHEVRSLIFMPGFSTVDSVTDFSGRGVGMDVVKTNVEKIGGAIDLESVVGVGTTVRMNIPLTLAIMPALLVKSGGQSFAIPQAKVTELVRIEDSSRGDQRLQWLQGRPMIRLRDKLLPVMQLSEILFSGGVQKERDESSFGKIAILKNDGISFGIAVDEVLDNIDIVVKPLLTRIKNLSAYSGATVMGDGSVVLILDIGGLAKMGQLSVSNKESVKPELDRRSIAQSVDSSEYLIADIGVPGKFAVPLCLVNRLEEFSRNDVQHAGELPVVRYRDGLLPILHLASRLGFSVNSSNGLMSNDRFSVIVVSKHNRLFGLAVSKILDVLTVAMDIDADISDRDGLLGSLIDGKDVVSVIDVLSIIDEQMGRIGRATKNGAPESSNHATSSQTNHPRSPQPGVSGLKILLAEDTSFFRRYVSSYLEALGHDVHAVVNGEEAFKRLETNGRSAFDLVLTDIEMPLMDGFELVQRIKARAEFVDLPVIALTTKFRNIDIKRGHDLGFTAYLEKFNGDSLSQTLNRIFAWKQAV